MSWARFRPRTRLSLGSKGVYGDIAINTGTSTFSEIRDDKPISRPARFSFLYRNRDGLWVIVDRHSSVVPAPAQWQLVAIADHPGLGR